MRREVFSCPQIVSGGEQRNQNRIERTKEKMKTNRMWLKRAAMLSAMAACALLTQGAFAEKVDTSSGNADVHLEDKASLNPTPMPDVKVAPKSTADTYEATGDLGVTMRHGDTMTLHFDIDKAYTSITSARLVLYMWDVDYPCATEQDNVYFNGTYLGRLEGLNQGWDYNYFNVPVSKITVPTIGGGTARNTVTINVSVDPSGWVTQCGSAQLIINGDTFSLTASRNLAGGISVNWDNVYGSYDLWRKGPGESDFTRIRQGITTNGFFDADVQIGKPYAYYAIQSGAKAETPEGASNTDEGLAGATDKPTITGIQFVVWPMVAMISEKSDYELFNAWVSFAKFDEKAYDSFDLSLEAVSGKRIGKTFTCSKLRKVGEKTEDGLLKRQYVARQNEFKNDLTAYDRGHYHFSLVISANGEELSRYNFEDKIFFPRDQYFPDTETPLWAVFWKEDSVFFGLRWGNSFIYSTDDRAENGRVKFGCFDPSTRTVALTKHVLSQESYEDVASHKVTHKTMKFLNARYKVQENPTNVIEGVALTLAHEGMHALIDEVFRPLEDQIESDRDYGWMNFLFHLNPLTSNKLGYDSLPNRVEKNLASYFGSAVDDCDGCDLLSDDCDTYNMGGIFNSEAYRMYGDNEFLARRAALKQRKWKNCGAVPGLDYAFPGCQSGRNWGHGITKSAPEKDSPTSSGGALTAWPMFGENATNNHLIQFSSVGDGTLVGASSTNGASALRFNVRVTCNTNEWQGITNHSLVVRGYLADKNGSPVAWTVSDITFTNKSVDVALDFAGEYIYAHRGSGYSLKYASLALAGIDIDMVAAVGVDVATTAGDISADAFNGKHFFLTGYNENVVGKNLSVHFNADVAESGIYTFKGHLNKTGTSETVAETATVVTNLTSGATTFPVELSFPGHQIYLSGVDGGYSLSFLAVSRDDTTIATKYDVYDLTNEYNHLDFKTIDSGLSIIDGSASFGEPATASDGFLGALSFSVSVNNNGNNGEFRITAALEEASSNKQYVASYIGRIELTNGCNQVSLSFPSGDIKTSGVDGPYAIRSIRFESLSDSSVVEVFRPNVISGEYKADDFGTTPVELIGQPVVNASGAAPVVTLTVEGLRDCIYNASAVLLDSNREFVAYVVTTNTITSGTTNTVTLAFDEAVLIASGHRGPYMLDYVMLEPQNGVDSAKLYSGAVVSDIDYTIADAYVDAVNGSDTNGGTSWSDAYKTIQAAVNVSMSGDTILVADGTYAPFQTGNKEITIQSRNGAVATIIDAGRSTANCVVAGTDTSHTNTIVSGFTLTGATGYVTQYGRFYNCITYDNHQGPYYGVFYNCTIADADLYIAYYCSFYNSIVWDTDHNNGIYCSSSSKYYNSCLQYNFNNGTGANNLIGVNPKFMDAANRDYRLLPGSPCVDAGTNEFVFGSVDALGKSRIQDAIVDIGAFEGTVQTESYNGFKYIKKLNGEVLIVGWNDDLPADVVIPAEIDGGRVVEICAGAFSNCTAMTSIDFGTNAVHCGDRAFYGCNKLTAVHVDDVSVWLRMTFDSAYSTPLTFARQLYVAGELLQNLEIPNGVESITAYAFYHCNSITNLNLGNVKNLANYAFDTCTALRTVTNNGKLKRIDFGAFEWCYALVSFEFRDGLEYVGGQAFLSDSLLKFDTLPDSVTYIGWNAFRGTAAEGEMWLPSQLTTLGATSFEGCKKLVSVAIPDGVTVVNGWTFRNCTSMRSLSIPASVTRMAGDYEFANCSKLNAVYYEGNAPTVTSTNLYFESFSVTNYVRYGSSGWGNTGYWQERPVRVVPFLYDVDYAGNAVITGYVGTVVGVLEIPRVLFGHRVVSIGDRAFEWQDQMTAVIIPEGVVSIGEAAFMDCLALKSITLPQTLVEIGRFAFAACWSLESVTIPANVADILGSAFRGCQDLSSVSFMGDAPNIESSAFSGVNSGATFIVLEGAAGWDDYKDVYNIVGRAPLAIATMALPNAIEMVEYASQLEATGGIAPYSWSCPDRGYTVTTNSTSTFAEIGNPQGWHADDSYWTLGLPFDFPFYGNKYRTAYVNSNGMISFGSGTSRTSYESSIFLANPIIAVLWRDLLTTGSSDVFVESGTDSVTIRWGAVYYNGGLAVNASITLYANGNVRLSYGNGNANGGFVGVSAGDGEKFIIIDNSSYSRNNAHDIILRSGGIANGLSLSENGHITGVPTETGTNTFTVTVIDAAGDTAEQEYSLVVLENPNHKPVIDGASPTTNIYVKVGDSATFTVAAHDPEGAPLQYTWCLDGDEIECTTASFTFAPALDDAGAHSLECIVSDGLWTDMVRQRWAFRVVRDWYVDAAAEEDSGDGSSSASALTYISEAVWQADDGDTIYVAPGTYNEYVEFDSSSTISVIATGGAQHTFLTGQVEGYGTEWYRGHTVIQSSMTGFTMQGCYLDGVTLRNCILTCDEAGAYPSQAYGCRLFDCAVTGNTCDYSLIERCELTRCTVAGNIVGAYGAVGYNSNVYDSILWSNVTSDGETSNFDAETWWDYDENDNYVEYASVQFEHSCTWPMPSHGADARVITTDPCLVDAVNGDLRLRVGSPCFVGGVQTMGLRLGEPVKGHIISVRVEGHGMVSPMTAILSDGEAATFKVNDFSRPFLGFSTNGVFVTTNGTLTWPNVKADGIVAAAFSNFTFHVDAATGDDANDGLSWGTAKSSIQSAINDAMRGETIYVKAGTYAPISIGGAMRLRIESVDGKAATIIDGGGTNQCANLGGSGTFSSTLIGFTLTNGYSSYGGGAYGGTLIDCDVVGNEARGEGGGLYYSNAIRCRISDNSVNDTYYYSASGGGAYGGSLINCLVVNNMVESGNYSYGGGTCYSSLYNCTVAGNVAHGNGYGGGAYYGYLYNTIVYGNDAEYGGETRNVWTLQNSCVGEDPGFADAANGDYHLVSDSPCIDAGNNNYVLEDIDLDGNERIQHFTVDIGCYEYELATPVHDSDADFALQMAGTCYGVFVGVGQYTYTSSLVGPTIDATNMQTRCVSKGYWQGANTVALLDTTATKSAVRERLTALAAKAVSGDTVLYYQSSHGGSHTSSGEYTKETYICLYDSRYEDYEMAEDLMKFAAGVKVIIVLDTCHSAGMFKGGGGARQTGVPFALRVREIMASRKAVKGAKSGITADDIGWIAAADYDEISYDSSQGGKFTLAMLSGWSSGEADYDGDNRLNFHELWRYAKGIATGYGETSAQCFNEDVLLSRFAGMPDSTNNGEATESTPIPVEHVWLDSYPEILASVGGDYEAMANAQSPGTNGGGKVWPDGSTYYMWQDFVAGTNPTNENSVFTAKIEIVNGEPVVKWEPDTPELRATRVYKTLGKKTLMDKDWVDITNKDQSEYHFFRVTVDLP